MKDGLLRREAVLVGIWACDLYNWLPALVVESGASELMSSGIALISRSFIYCDRSSSRGSFFWAILV